ncbi:MAG: pilus assembly protein PilY [Gammaproteobacteria bacterium]|nr:pilus assembly protein PilY [Gammaproteobacteria bacterium]MBU0851593.1 pilus assembly protein PilY [Gammaproteobacteria bacterium]MBU1774647.1 pilus assembly protein PilY [Gammaproteobacteria bacterium]
MAYHNGFQTSYGSINLSNSYRVSWNFSTDGAVTYNYSSSVNYAAPTGRIYNLSENPHDDFGSFEDITLISGSPVTREILGATHTFTRNNNNSCTVSPSTSGITCSRNSGNSYRITRNRTQTAVPAYYYTYDASLAGCNADKNNDACHRLVFVSSNSGPDGADERENFAIWYSFYRTRALATVSAANLAFNELASSARLTWQTLDVCDDLNSSGCGTNYFREFSPRHKANFLNWLAGVKFNSSTPLLAATKRAGEFYTETTPWAHTPNPMTSSGGRGTTVTNPQHACRPSFHVLMTDGMWNDGSFPSGISRHDGATFTPGATGDTSFNYDGKRAPFGNDAKSTTGTLADIAMHYWATDLRNSLANELKPYIHTKNTDAEKQFWDPRNNPATWQHMVNYTMGLGLSNSLNAAGIPWTGDTFGGSGYTSLAAGTAKWPAASASNASNVYDLWHAAINSRGEFFSVDSPDDMVKAFKDILNRIAERTTTAARPAVSASFVTDNAGGSLQSNVYATQFSSEDWSGELSKTTLAAGQTKKLWTSTTSSPNNRKIMMAGAETTSSKLKVFNWSNLGDLQGLLNINPESLVGAKDNRGAERVDYIRGNRSIEGDSETSFRRRNSSTVIGDIINSSPVVVGTPAYMAYLADAIEKLDRGESYKNYTDFREDNRKLVTDSETNAVVSGNRKEMIYVGSNDGMLHGFNAATGVEEFAFIPTEVIKNLYRLTGKNYSGGEHHYFVDGTPIVRDVYLGDDEGWRTVLIGTLRAGGKALFALDITDPENIKLLWEFDSTTDEDLGYTFAQPEIVRLHTGEWAVLQGNGYNSSNDRAALLIIDIKTGELIKKITVPEVTEDDIILPNGLSSVRGADNNGDGLVDYAYAGDLQGNIWRFDLVKPTDLSEFEIEKDGQKIKISDPFHREIDDIKNTSKDDYKLSYDGKPLFTARDSKGISRQPITIQPSLVRHPTSYGYLVLVGTGKYFEHSDANVDTSRAMTLYGVWDRKTKRQKTDSTTITAQSRSRLVTQEFTDQQNGAIIDEKSSNVTRDIRLLSTGIPQWYKAAADGQPPVDTTKDVNVNHWGWALNMAVGNKLEGEMIINNMTASGSILFLSSLTPNQDPCQAGADTWLYAVDAFSGGRTRFNVLDLNADRIVDNLDRYNGNVTSGMRFPALGGFTLAPGNQVFGSDGAADPATVGDDPNSSGRQSWHIVPEKYQ